MARPIVLIPYLFRLTGAIIFRKDYSLPPLVLHLDPTSRTCIVVSPNVLSSPNPSRPPLTGSAKTYLKDLVVPNVSSSQDEKAKSASKEHVEAKKPTNSTRAPSKHP